MQWTATGLTRPKPSMPPSRKHHNRIRDLVLQSAGRLFNRHGFNAVSIDDVMAEAGLTRGSFYCYFSSKSDLYAQSVARVVHEDRENPKGGESERTRADKIVLGLPLYGSAFNDTAGLGAQFSGSRTYDFKDLPITGCAEANNDATAPLTVMGTES